MSLTDEDKAWISEQLERVRLDRVGSGGRRGVLLSANFEEAISTWCDSVDRNLDTVAGDLQKAHREIGELRKRLEKLEHK